MKKTKPTEKADFLFYATDSYWTEIYGCWAGLGWGTAIVRRKDLAVAAFTAENTAIKTIINTKLWKEYKKFKNE